MHCPSADPDDPQAAILGVVRRDEGTARVQILPQTLPPETLTGHVPASLRRTEVLRFAAPCAEGACLHFDGERCQLADRIVALLPPRYRAPTAMRYPPDLPMVFAGRR